MGRIGIGRGLDLASWLIVLIAISSLLPEQLAELKK